MGDIPIPWKKISRGIPRVRKFAVEFHAVLDGSADKTYTDAKLFLDNIFLISNIKLMLRDAFVRVSRGEGQPVYIIDRVRCR